MSEEGSRVVLTRHRHTFIKRKHSLDALHKDLDHASKEAVEVLLDIMQTTQDEKLKASCAEKLLKFKIDVATEIGTDQMQRLIAEIKFGGGQKQRNLTTDDDDRPILDFDTVQ